MSSSLHTALTSAALAGLLAGLTACGDSAPPPTPEAAAPEAPAAPTAAATEQPAKPAEHACKGLNECKGQGGCHVEGKNGCAGYNECKAQGGCCTHSDKSKCPSADAAMPSAPEPPKAG